MEAILLTSFLIYFLPNIACSFWLSYSICSSISIFMLLMKNSFSSPSKLRR
nr:MAG TPA: hypothetical protein [Caudoviricetes sp.]DAK04215.1 MAG TPA: hypothetical protein [Caudoviricetes sp.]